MAQQYASGETMRLTVKLTPADVTMTGNKDVGTTSGRFFLSNNNQVEWISFTGKTANGDGTYTYTGLTRGLSQTADPITAGTGSTWLANQEAILVAMHDQLVDKTQPTTFSENITFAKSANFSGTTTAGLTIKSLTTAQRDALTPNVGDKIINTTTGTEQTYYGGTWNDAGTNTTPNASTTVAGKVEQATQSEVNAGTITGSTGAVLFADPSTIKVVTDALSASISTVDNKIGGTTMTLGETLVTGDVVSIDSATGKVVKAVSTGSDTVVSSGSGNITLARVVALSSTTVIFSGHQAIANSFYVRAGTISGNTITLGSQTGVGGSAGSPGFLDVVALDATTFAVGFGYQSGGFWVAVRAATVSGTTITVGNQVDILVNSGSTPTYGAMTKITSSKYSFSYAYGASNRMTVYTVSGSTTTGGAEVSGFALLPTAACYVSNDKLLVSEGTNARLYTTSGTVPTQGNNLALPATYTNISLRYIGNSKSIFCGTNGGTTFAFIIDSSGATPTNGTVVTVLASSTSNDCFMATANTVGVVTGNNKVYYYSYSGTTLTYINNYTNASSIGLYKSVDYLYDNVFINSYVSTTTGIGYVMSNRQYYILGILQSGGVLDDSRFIKTVGGYSTIHSGLSTGLGYFLTGTSITVGPGSVYIGKAISSTTILVGIPYSTF